MFHLHVFGCTWFSNLLVCVQISNIPVCTQTTLQTGRWHIHVRHKHPKQNYCNTMKTLFPKTSVALPYFQVAFSFCPNSYKRTENILAGLSQPTSNSSTLSLRTGCSHGFPALKKNKCSYVPRIILAGLRWYDSKWVSRIICLNPDRRSAEPDSVRAENAYLVLLLHNLTLTAPVFPRECIICYSSEHNANLTMYFLLLQFPILFVHLCILQKQSMSYCTCNLKATKVHDLRNIPPVVFGCRTPLQSRQSCSTKAPLRFVPWLNSSHLKESYLCRRLKLTLKKNRTHLSLSPQTALQHTNTLWRTDA